ncbi:MAG: hypothetical protein ACOC2H_01585 [Spirochaetota bacterium]
MLNFFIILLTNISTGVIIYLILTIRLEKKTSSYEQEKVRREFEEVIRDFNESAERNISILENRIAVMKRLMKLSGTLESVDVEAADRVDAPSKNGKRDAYTIVKDLPETSMKAGAESQRNSRVSYVVDEKIELDISRDEAIDDPRPDEGELIRQRYEDSGQKHDTLVALFTEGHSVEKIAESTGVSSAEIELILNLNGIHTANGESAHGF